MIWWSLSLERLMSIARLPRSETLVVYVNTPTRAREPLTFVAVI